MGWCAAAGLLLGSSACSAVTPVAAPAGCPDVEVVFARGTHQPPGLGRVGDAFAHAIAAGLPGRRVDAYGVDYPADSAQHFALGATDITRHVGALAATCPMTSVVLGGYSQGALAVAAAIGVPMARPPVEALASPSAQVVAVVVFGDPLGSERRSIETEDTPFRSRSVEYCHTADAVCGGRGPEVGTHHSYPDDGTTDRAAALVAERLRG
jgi:cutinase